jgi:hypothetical protein
MAGLWQDPYRSIALAHRASDATGLVGKEGYAISVDGAAKYTLAAIGGTNFRGVCTSGGIAAADKCGAALGYLPSVVTGAVVAEGDYLTLDSASRFITWAGNTVCVGMALQASGAAGETIQAVVWPGNPAQADLTLAAGTEAANVIAITVAGRPSTTYVIEGYEATMIEAAAAALTLAETGAGAEVSTTAQARLLFTTSTAGAAIVSATDVAGASGKTFQMLCYPVDGRGDSARVAITFD